MTISIKVKLTSSSLIKVDMNNSFWYTKNKKGILTKFPLLYTIWMVNVVAVSI